MATRNASHASLAPPVAESLLRCMLAHFRESLIMVNNRRTIVSADPSVAALLGYDPARLAGRKIWSLFPRDRRSHFTSKIIQGISAKKNWSGEVSLLDHKGKPRPFRLCVVPVDHADSKQAGVAFLLGEPSANGKSRAPGLNGAHHDAVFASMEDGIVVADLKGAIRACNRSFCALLGYVEKEILGVAPPYPWIGAMDQQKFRFGLKILEKEGRLRNYTVACARRDGSIIVTSMAFALLKDPSGAPAGIVINVRDISDIQYVEELRRTNERMHRLVADVQRKAERLHTLEAVNSLVLDNANVDRIFRSVVGSIRHLVPHDLAGMYMYDAGRDHFFPHTISKITPFSKRLARFPIPFGQGIIGKAAISGSVVIANNAERDGRSRYPSGMKPEKEHIVAVPLRGRRSIYGVLVVARNADPPFLEEDGQVVKSFAEATSVALENARFVDELERMEAETVRPAGTGAKKKRPVAPTPSGKKRRRAK